MRTGLPMAIAGALAGIVLPTAAPAQNSERVLVIYGNDRCPTDKSGQEIVVCSRRPEAERYRIPQNLRETGEAGNETWNDRSRSLTSTGASGIGSCTPIGPGGGMGCFKQQVRQNRAEQQRRKQGEPDVAN